MSRCQCAMAAREQGTAVSSPRPHPVSLSPNKKKVEDVGATKFARLPLFDTPRHDRFGGTAAMATAHGVDLPERSAQKSHEEDAAPPIVETKVICPYCDEWFLKSEVASHIKPKTCTKKPQQPSLPSSTAVQPQFEEDSRSSPTIEMECVDSDQRIVPHNDPRDMQVDSSPVDGGPKGTTKDRDDERIARLEEHVEYLSKQLQKVTSDLKKVHYMLNILAPDPTSVKKLYPSLRTDD
uniref:Uncharacterized protein n=1 Tax=Ixodes ricinus TaxID=34613 RepID=A0A131Y7Y5_IXORI